MNFADLLKPLRPSSIKSAVKIWLYRLIGLNARAERYLDIYLSQRIYRKMFGRKPDLKRPTLFSEKITARKLYERRPIFTMLADKVLVRDFVAERIGARFLPELYLVCDRFEEIDFARLPEKFVIKTNHGCRWMTIVDDKATFDKTAARHLFRRWMRDSYHLYSREFLYKSIERRILVEEFLQESSGAPVIDYKLYVYDGTPKFLLVTQRRFIGGERTVAFFDRSGQRMSFRAIKMNRTGSAPRPRANDDRERTPSSEIKPPANIEQLYEIAGRLAHGFDFMRVDLYTPGGRILFGEMTSLPTGGVIAFDPPDYDRIFGEPWRLSLNGS